MSESERQQIITAFLERSGWEGAQREPISGDASFRRYERVRRGEHTAIVMDAPPDKEPVAPFVRVGRFLCEAGLSAPEILAEEEKAGLLLLEDLRDGLFSRLLQRDPAQEQALYLAAMEALLALQRVEKMPALPTYDDALLMQEVALFADWYLPVMLGKAEAARARQEFCDLWRELLQALPVLPPVVVLRDFHADNLLWLPERDGVRRVGLLDFQDAVMGSPAYDMVSFLEDARREVAPTTREAVLEAYIEASGVEREAFLTACALLAAQRNTKIIGIFMRLALRDGKHAYPAMIPHVWRLLEQDVEHPLLASLKHWLDTHIPVELRRAVPERKDEQACP